jgi:glucose-1-phosphate thymidylyltransferase
MKAVLLAAGKGSRLYPITNSISKPMISIAGKPILAYVLEDLIQNNFDEFCIVINKKESALKNKIGNGEKYGVKITYAIQENFLGTGDALKQAKSFVKNDSFLLYLSDTLITESLKTILTKILKDSSDVGIVSTMISDDEISRVGTIEIKNNDHVKKIMEKSPWAKSNIAWAGVAYFKNGDIFNDIKNIVPSERNEYEITDAMNRFLENGGIIQNYLSEKFIDTGTPNGLYQATKFILDHKHICCINNHQNFLKPNHVGENCQIGKNVKIGPFTSIGNNVKIGNNVIIQESIILDDTKINENEDLVRCILSNDGKIYF